jgi:hypothetical protein
MSEKVVTPPAPAPDAAPAGPETQSERWLKYGVNVVLTSVVVLVLAGIVIWAAQGTQKSTEKLRGRKDLSGDASNVLKPQTVQLIRELPAGDDKAITLVSLYPKLKKEEAAAKGADTYQRVQDILDEYRRNGQNIKVEAIDPVAEPGKLDAWLGEVKRRYGKNIDQYEKFVKEFPKTLEEIKALAAPEAKQLLALGEEINKSADKLTDEQIAAVNSSFRPAYSTVAAFPRLLEQLNEGAKAELEQKIPDYAGAVKVIKNGSGLAPGLSTLSRQCGTLATMFDKTKDDKTAPEQLKAYAKDAGKRFLAIKAKADESLKKTEGLGELKLDDVRRKLVPAEDGTAAPPAVAVMGPDDVRVIDDFSLWKGGTGSGLAGGGANDKPRLRFAGEQQLTSAILGLAQTKKQKIAFVRAGGEAKTTFGRGGPPQFGEVADRLKSYNFDVVEKDLAPPARQQPPMPNPNEPSDEDLKAAIWVVFASPPQQDPQMAMMGMPPQASPVLGERLKAHLDAGGSALCLVDLEGDDLSAALKDWGIEAKPNTLLTHEKIKGGEASPDDFIEQARRQPFIFVLNEFGEHPVTTSLRSLDAAMVPVVQVKKAAAVPAGVTVTEIVPMPSSPKSWGETDLSAIRSPDGRRPPPDPTFDPAADAPGPVYAGAAAEKAGKGRLVVIGTQNAFNSVLLTMADPKLEKAKTIVSRFPANGELFTNSIFWLAKNEKMIALSPSAMDTARIAAVEPGKLAFIRYGLILVVLPLLAVAAGVGVWFTRRG